MKALLLAALLVPGVAVAEQWVYSAFGGGGVGVHLAPSGPPRAAGTVMLESVFGLTDELNLETVLLLELERTAAASVGVGLEYVYFQRNHWRLEVGAGVALRYAFSPTGMLHPGPYLMAAVRWLFAWGIGASVSLHVLTSQYASLEIVAFPSLSLYQEFW